MPSARRTRAMGLSPGGPQALDINAPTRKPRKAKASTAAKDAAEDAAAPVTRVTRAHPGPKRKNEDVATEELPAKKTRLTKTTEEPETIVSNSQALHALPESENEPLLERTPSLQEEEPDLAVEQVIESRVTAQQPTPPLDTPINATPLPTSTKTPRTDMQEKTSLAHAQNELDKKKQSERRISDMMQRYRIRHQEEEEDEAKALSECDDDEWEERFPSVMSRSKNPIPFIPKSTGEYLKWDIGSNAMFVVRKPQQKDIAARNKSSPCMTPLTFSPGFFTTTSRLAALGARGITDVGVIVAMSASLDWYEKNPSNVAPTAAEMAAMLDDFARSKQAQQSHHSPGHSHAPSLANTQNTHNPTPDAPLTPKAQIANDEFPEAPSPSESNDDHFMVDQEELEIEQNEDLIADAEDNRIEPTEAQTPQQQGSQGARTWASALSASAIGNVFFKPVNWFTRRDRARQNISATEPRPVRAKADVTRSAKPLQRAHPRDAPAQTNKTLLAQITPSRDPKAGLLPDSPTPAVPQPRRGRPDSHLPVHLRGVRYEDLPSEWQAVSQHMKKPQHAQVEDEESSVDLDELREIARRTRKERDRKELQEQAERIAQKQRDLESDEESSDEHADSKGKKKVTFSPPKTHSAKLGHSTFGLPANIDESSSEEEPEFLKPRIFFGRNSKPKKSCLKRSYQQPTSEDFDRLECDGEDGDQARPAKKARLDEFAPSESSEILEAQMRMASTGNDRESTFYDDVSHRARPPSGWLSIPPSELRTLERDQADYERRNPIGRRPSYQAELDGMRRFMGSRSGSQNVFRSPGYNSGAQLAFPYWHRKFAESAKRVSTSPYTGKPGISEKTKIDLTKKLDPRIVDGSWSAKSSALRELRGAQLNKEREKALQYKPKKPSGLQETRVLSPIYEERSSINLIQDHEVVKMVKLLDDNEILPEGFGNHPDYYEGTVETEASKAIEYPT